MSNTKRNTWGGSRVGAGRHKRATAQRNGRVYVALDKIASVKINGVHFISMIETSPYSKGPVWVIGSKTFTDYAAAAAEFVRRVNG